MIRPDWPAPASVRALVTTRAGGISEGAWRSLNLGQRGGDRPEHVERNRARLQTLLPAPPRWLRQVHGTRVAVFADAMDEPEADAILATRPGEVCAVLTADCPRGVSDRWRHVEVRVIAACAAVMPPAFWEARTPPMLLVPPAGA